MSIGKEQTFNDLSKEEGVSNTGQMLRGTKKFDSSMKDLQGVPAFEKALGKPACETIDMKDYSMGGCHESGE